MSYPLPRTVLEPSVPLLVAALALLHRPCPRNASRAALLLQRAALCATLTPVEREICQSLADELECA